jgi:hypothetical protein
VDGGNDTSDVLAIVDTAVDGAECAAGDDGLDDELGGVDLPVLPAPPKRRLQVLRAQPRGLAAAAPSPGPGNLRDGGGDPAPLRRAAEVALELLVQALEIDLVRPHEPCVPAARAGVPHARWKQSVWRRGVASGSLAGAMSGGEGG